MKVHVNSKYSNISEFINSVPEIFAKEGETVYDLRNTIKVFCVDGITVNIKSFKKPNIINRFAYKYIRKSKAARSYLNALEILDRGISTPEPIGYIEISKNGLIDKSYYISIHEQVEGTMKEVYRRPKPECKGLIKAFIAFTVEVHKKGILHKDYSPGNILFKNTGNGYHFYLVDLNRMSFKNICILDSCKSFSRLHADDNTLNFISEEYSKKRKYNKRICQKLIHIYNRRFWKKHLMRHPECRYEFQ